MSYMSEKHIEVSERVEKAYLALSHIGSKMYGRRSMKGDELQELWNLLSCAMAVYRNDIFPILGIEMEGVHSGWDKYVKAEDVERIMGMYDI